MVSIIVLTYNNKAFIRLCLNSVFRQKYQDFKVIVIDNGSKDGTVELIENNYPNLTLIKNNENLGASRARNQGITASRGKWILTLDCDVILEEGFLSNALALVRNVPANVGMLQPKILYPDKRRIYSCGLYLSWMRRFYDIGKNEKNIGRHDNEEEIFGACSAAAFYKRSMLEDIKESTGYFDETFFFLVEDVDVAWRAQRKNWKALFLPELICYHSGDSSSTNNKTRQYLCFRNRYLMIAKNEGWKNYFKRILPLLLYDIPRWAYLFLSNPYFRRRCHSEERRSLDEESSV